jgi:hypothetical protein
MGALALVLVLALAMGVLLLARLLEVEVLQAHRQELGPRRLAEAHAHVIALEAISAHI